ncbi:MAG: L-histidine N(alpha)-methyltransferase [Blastocatellia bacterium]
MLDALNKDLSSRLAIHRTAAATEQNGFAGDVRAGLTAMPKTLPPKYFYDPLGSRLFEAICHLPEYYLTRAETEIFETHATAIVAEAASPVTVVELGSGSSIKTRLLIEALLARQGDLHYQPIDISETILVESALKLLGDYASLHITAQAADYTRGLGAIARHAGERVLVLFLGSNIGNYKPTEARALLHEVRRNLQAGDGLLLGVDLKKSAAILEPAYDDALGVTAAFNLNLLAHINRELDADFDVRRFRHRSRFNEAQSRIETHLVSCMAQTINIRKLDLTVEFGEGETIHTEYSYKYDLEMLSTLARDCGFESRRTWFDSQQRFSCNFWVAVE